MLELLDEWEEGWILGGEGIGGMGRMVTRLLMGGFELVEANGEDFEVLVSGLDVSDQLLQLCAEITEGAVDVVLTLKRFGEAAVEAMEGGAEAIVSGLGGSTIRKDSGGEIREGSAEGIEALGEGTDGIVMGHGVVHRLQTLLDFGEAFGETIGLMIKCLVKEPFVFADQLFDRLQFFIGDCPSDLQGGDAFIGAAFPAAEPTEHGLYPMRLT